MCDNAAVHEGAEGPLSSDGGQKGSLSRMWGDQNHHTSLSRSARGSRPLGVFAACLGPEWWQRLGWGCSPRSQQGLAGPSSAPRPTQLPGGRAMIVPIFKARKSSSSEDYGPPQGLPGRARWKPGPILPLRPRRCGGGGPSPPGTGHHGA